jgi:hypothetical protein|tara:strand:- start:1836 stop:2180 length:345 start_codon:yes stop_codon:yes gene_type:complete
MKKLSLLLLLLLLSILFQSCFSYKTVDYNNIAIEKKQKFEVKGVEGKYIKGRLVSKNEKTMTLENKEGLQTIPVKEIYDVKVRKFSFLKSAGVIVGGWFTIVILLIGFIGLVIM